MYVNYEIPAFMRNLPPQKLHALYLELNSDITDELDIGYMIASDWMQAGAGEYVYIADGGELDPH